MNDYREAYDIPEQAKIAQAACEHCGGSGWEEIEVSGSTGVRRCRCGGVPPAFDPMGVAQ